MTLAVGDRAPPFVALDQNGREVRSSDFAGRRFVLYFYPADNTTICTIEACTFRNEANDFEALDVPVVGVSHDSVESHRAFAARYRLPFTLLADPDRAIIKAYDAHGFLGRTNRTTYIIGPDGRIEGVRRAELSGKGHVEWAKGRLATLRTPAPAALGPR